jgi:RimJ/RimL family protein N-acetyltransferase
MMQGIRARRIRNLKTGTLRLSLRPFDLIDFDDLLQLYSDPEVMRLIGNGKPRTRDETEAWLTRMIAHWAQRGLGMWAVHEKSTGRFVGRCGLQALADTSEIELGYALHRAFWGQGLATEAAMAAIQFGFETIGLSRIVAIALPENLASRRVIEKTGLVFERIGPNPYGHREVAWYGLSRAAYVDHRASP